VKLRPAEAPSQQERERAREKGKGKEGEKSRIATGSKSRKRSRRADEDSDDAEEGEEEDVEEADAGCLVQDTQVSLGGGGGGILGSYEPFKGCVITATGVEKVRSSWRGCPERMLTNPCCVQNELFEKARKLGARTEGAFTDQVTHLVALDPEGAKYKASSHPYPMLIVQLLTRRVGLQCAVERCVPILHPSWIFESYKVWLRGDDVDLADVRRVPSSHSTYAAHCRPTHFE
jgi:hypothetical protein